MQKEDKKLIFVLCVFIITLASILIIRNNYYTKQENKVVFNTQGATTTIDSLYNTSVLQTSAVEFPIDINSITKEELMQIDGIGEKTASKIIEYRYNNGGFSSLEELLNVADVGEKTFENLKQYLYIETQISSESVSTDIPTNNEVSESTIKQTTKATETAQITSTSSETTTIATTTINYPIDINFASKDELMSLSGIGEVKAQEIINYRNSVSYFYSISDIKNVKGIGDSTFSSIQNYIYVDTNKIPQTTSDFFDEFDFTQSISITITSSTTSIETITTSTVVTSEEQPQIVNINTASLDELASLPKMNTELAKLIIEFRENTGSGFILVEELTLVIDLDVYNAIKDYVTV